MNPPDRASREKEIFEQSFDFDSLEAKLAYLKGACGDDAELLVRVQALLRAHDADEAFLPGNPQAAATVVVPVTEKPGDTIGRYKLREKLGEGGCGVVYVADQEQPIRRRVALKVIKLGMDTQAVVSRFDAERQALAMMDHPNIARVLDAGATESGRPYFVMELVRGIKITDYCDQNNLSTRERLNLFIQVCHAIQHAHQKGIIHRDIKPSNILVTLHDGVPVPKVIDFGIAKATEGRLTDATVYTQLHQFIGTPAYMSPEQAEMSGLDIDTRSDIYGLGVLLYELLTGRTPFDANELLSLGLEAMRRTIREQEPERPSTRLAALKGEESTTTAKRRSSEMPKLISLLKGDLDWIAMRCLEKDRTRRYATAIGLATDLEHHLNHEPVSARPPSTAYRVRKFVRRNRLMVTATCSVAAALVLGILVSTGLAIRAMRAEEAARNARDVAVDARENEAKQKVIAQQAEQVAREQAYAANINLAYQAWQQSNLGRVRRLLAQSRPTPGDEGARSRWEWRYLWGLTRGNDLGEVARFDSGVWRITCAENSSAIAVGLLGMAVEEKGGFLYDLGPDRLSKRRQFAANGLSDALFLPGSGRLLSNRPDDLGHPGISVLDAANLQEVTRLQTSKEVRLMRVSRDGRWLASLEQHPGRNSTLGVWRTEDWSRCWETGVDGDGLFDGGRIDFLRSDTRLAVGSAHGRVTVFETGTGATNLEFTVHSGADSDEITALAYLPAAGLLAIGAGYDDSKINLWDPETGTFVRGLTHHQAHIPDLAVSPDGHWLASASADQTVRLWDVSSSDPASWTNLYTLRGHEDEVYCLAFSSDGKRLISGDREGSLRLWQVPPEESHRPLHIVREDCGRLLRLSPDSRRIATFWSGTNCLVWDMDTGTKLDVLGAPAGICQFSPDGKQLLAGGPGGKVRVWDFGLKSWSEFDTGRSEAHSTQPLFYVPGTNLVLLQHAIDTGLECALWQFDQRHLVSAFPAPGMPFWSCSFSPRGDFAVLHLDGSLTLQKTTAPFAQTNFWPHRRGVRDIAFTPDGALFATAGEDGTARVWDAATRREILPLLKGHLLSTIRALDISADGRRLATAGAGRGAVKLWDLRTHQELISLDSEGWTMEWILFSADGNKLVGLNSQRHLHIWRAPSWEEITAAEAKEQAGGLQP